MKIVRFRSKAIIFLVVFTVSVLIVTRIAVISTSTLDTSAANNKELGVAKKDQKNDKSSHTGNKIDVNDRRDVYDAKSVDDNASVDMQKRSINSTASKNSADKNVVAEVEAIKKGKILNVLPPHLANLALQVGGNSNISTQRSLGNSKFIAERRIVHLDLKGAPPKVHYFEIFFRLIKNLGATGLLIEWEDMFPYSGTLEVVRNANAYTEDEVRTILSWAKEMGLEVIPLVQTFGHLEWILKHPPFSKLREVERYAQVVCLSNPEAIELVKTAIDQVMVFHKDQGEFFHMGADEAFQIGHCEKCQKTMRDELGHSRDRLMLRHITTIAKHINQTYNKRVLMWHDMLNSVDPNIIKEFKLGEIVEPVIWAYAEDLNGYLGPDTWNRFSQHFPYVWAASAFKGADGPNRFYANIPHYVQNHVSWVAQMNNHYKNFREFRGIFLTGWQRFDHFAILCELLPVGIPSLAINLLIIKTGEYNKAAIKQASDLMQCGAHPFDPNNQGIGGFCQFPGAKIYQFVQQFKISQKNMRSQLLDDYMLRGWLTKFNVNHNYSSSWYLDQLVDKINMYYNDMANIARNLRMEMLKVFHKDTVDEFLYTYVNEDLDTMLDLKTNALKIGGIRTFPGRPFPIQNAPKLETTTTKPPSSPLGVPHR